MIQRQVSLDELNAAGEAVFVAALGDIFEHSPWVAAQAYAQWPFSSLKALFEALIAVVNHAPLEQRLSFVRAHPDIGFKAGRASALTVASISEQQSAGLDRLSDAEYDTFQRLNTSYKSKFGFPFIVCVKRRTRESMLAQFEQRVHNDPSVELESALREIGHIVALRLSDRVTAPDRLAAHGALTTHVLDTHSGRPAAGVRIELIELSDARRIADGVTNADGRLDRPLVSGRPFPIGRYELRFDIGAYFAAQHTPLADPPFLTEVPVRFGVAEPESHYHVPLLATPWSYATYRGS